MPIPFRKHQSGMPAAPELAPEEPVPVNVNGRARACECERKSVVLRPSDFAGSGLRCRCEEGYPRIGADFCASHRRPQSSRCYLVVISLYCFCASHRRPQSSRCTTGIATQGTPRSQRRAKSRRINFSQPSSRCSNTEASASPSPRLHSEGSYG